MRYGWLFLLPVLLSACHNEPTALHHRFKAFGLPAEVALSGPAATVTAESRGIEDDVHFIAEVSDPARPGPLGRTNMLLAAAGEFSANPSVLELIHSAQRLAPASGGRFNPACGRLYRLRGAYGDAVGPSTEQAIKAVLAATPRMSDIVVKGIHMRGTNTMVELEFGPLPIGYALAIAASRLRHAGLSRGWLEIGGSTLVLPGRATRIESLPGIGAEPLVKLALHGGETLFTLSAGKKGRQLLLDPRTGRPVPAGRRVWVIDHDPQEAAAKAAALAVAGPAEWADLTRNMPIDAALIEEPDGHLYANPVMGERFEDTAPPYTTLAVRRP